MRRPRKEWHEEVLDSDVLRNLDAAVDSCENERVIKLVERLATEPFPGETPEFLAKQVGNWLCDRGGDDFRTPVSNDTDGKEGESLALGYIGVKAFEIADFGDVTS